MALLPLNFHKAVVAVALTESAFENDDFCSGFLLSNEEDKEHVYLVSAKGKFWQSDDALSPSIYVAGCFSNEPVELNLEKCLLGKAVDNDVLISVLKLKADIFGITEGNTSPFLDRNLLRDPRAAGVCEADMILVAGFMDIVDHPVGNYPIVRGGIIARIVPVYEKQHSCFLVDAQLFKGYCGAPVFLRPWPYVIDGSAAHDKPLIIGVVIDCLNRCRELPVKQAETAALGWVAPAYRISDLITQIAGTSK